MNIPLTILIVILAIAAAVGLFIAARRFSPKGGHFNDGDRAAGVFGVLATGFSVLLGFVVYLAFTTYDTALTGAQAEATDVLQQYQTAQLLPQPSAAVLSGELICYGRAAVNIEWPQLQHGERPFANPWGVSLFETFTKVVPKTAAQQAAYSTWLDQTNQRQTDRLARIDAGSGTIPGPLWLILFVTGALVALYAFLFADPDEHWLPQAVIAGTIAAMLVISLLVIRFLQNPYSPGTGALRPTEMNRTLAELTTATKALGIKVVIPCDALGRPAH